MEDVNDRYFSAKEIKADLSAQKVTKESPCPKCKTMNNVRTPFCTKCGGAVDRSDGAVRDVGGKYNRMGGGFAFTAGTGCDSQSLAA